jgi:hypothetical protein
MKSSNIAKLVGLVMLPAISLSNIGCGTFNGVCQDGKTLFTALGNQTEKYADKEEDFRKGEEKKNVQYKKDRHYQVLKEYENEERDTARKYNQANPDSDQ